MFGLNMPEPIVILVMLPVIFLPTLVAWRTPKRALVLIANLGAVVVAAIPFGVFLSLAVWIGALVVAIGERR